MGFGDVLSGKQSFGSWLTGRDVKEQDLYVDIDKAEATIDEVNNIANSIPSAGSAVSGALSALNSVNGMALIGGLQLGNVEAAFDTVTAQVKSIASQMDKRVGDAKYYSSSTWDKIWGTAGMVVAKAGEGFLGAFEDIGDGVVSIVGWVGGKFGADTQWAEDFVAKDWSHDVMDWAYYSRDISKYSAFTEDSAIAGACEIAGKAAGYMYAGGALNGLMGTTGKALSIAGKTIASSSTLAATAVAGIGGMGSGTQTGLYQGKSFMDAVQENGKNQMITNAALAFVGGKLGERASFNRAAKDLAGKGATRAEIRAARQLIREDLKSGIGGGYNAGQFQGYTDAFTQAGERFGTATRNVIGSGAQAVNANVRNILTRGSNPVAKTQAQQAAQNANQAFKGNLGTLARENPVSQLGRVGFNGVKGTWNAVTHPGETLKNAGAAIKSAPGNAAKAVGEVIKHPVVALEAAAPVVAPVAIAGLDQTVNETAADQFRETGIVTPDRETPTGVPKVTGEPIIPDNPADQIINGGGTQPPVTEAPPITQPPTTTQPPITTQPPVGGGGPSTETPKVTTPTVTTPSVSIEVPTQPQVTTPVVEPTYPEPTSTVVTPGADTPASDHFGGGYSGAGGFDGDTEPELSDLDAVKTSIDDIIKGNKYSKIPTSAKPLAKAQSGSTGSTVIPLSAGLSAAAAVGLGAKAYLDKKTRSEDEEEDDIERWQGEGSVELAPEKVEEDPLLDESSEGTLQSRILESVTGESYSDL